MIYARRLQRFAVGNVVPKAKEVERAFIRPKRFHHATVLGAAKARPGNGEQVSRVACRPTLTAPARAGVLILWLGRKKACGAVEQKKWPEARNIRRIACPAPDVGSPL